MSYSPHKLLSQYSIQGKCNVVCTAKDKRNREPSEAQLSMADYFFKNCFDMGRLSIVGEFGDLIGGVKGQFSFYGLLPGIFLN